LFHDVCGIRYYSIVSISYFYQVVLEKENWQIMAWFKVPGSRFTVEGKTDSRFLTVNREPKTLIRYVVYDFRSIVNPIELLPKIEPCPNYSD